MPSTARDLSVSARLVLLALGVAGPLLGFASFVLLTVSNGLPRHDLPPIALTGASSLIAAAAMAWWAGRRIARPIEALSGAAAAFVRGEQPPAQPRGLREASEIATALRRVFDRLAECEAARAVEEDRYRAIPETAALPDAGARNEVDAARRHLEEQLHQSQKMEALGQLTGGIAHDFNNLLLAINLNLESLAEDVAASDMTAPLFTGARDAVEQGRALIGQLLAFGRRQSLRPVSFDVNAATLDTVMMLRRMLPAAISIHAPFGRDLWPVYADRNQLATALLNLALNARDAMPEGGRLDIKTANATVDRRAAAANPEAPAGDYVMIAICDTGAGMDAAVVVRAFDPFFTTKKAGDGTGLGLSQVYGYARQSGGFVQILSDPGRGTTVKLFLPRGRSAAAAARLPFAAGPLRGRGETILAVEDTPIVRNAVIRMLGDLGYSVIAAQNGPDAVRLLEADGPIDLLFTDLILPGGIGGIELARLARRLRPGLRVLFTSGYTETTVEGFELISKPYGNAQLAERVRAALGAAAPPGPKTSAEIAA